MPKSVKCLSILEEECHKFVLISFSNAIIFCICGDKDTIFMDKHQTFLVKNVFMLWDDDAEGGDSLCLVLMEREAAAAYRSEERR